MNQNNQFLTQVAIDAQKLLDAETSVVALAEDEGGTVFYAAAVGKHAEFILNRRGSTQTSGLCGVAFQEQQPVLVCQTLGDNRVRQDMVEKLGIQTALSVPLLHAGQLLGALMLLNRRDGNLYDEASQQILTELCQQYRTPCVQNLKSSLRLRSLPQGKRVRRT